MYQNETASLSSCKSHIRVEWYLMFPSNSCLLIYPPPLPNTHTHTYTHTHIHTHTHSHTHTLPRCSPLHCNATWSAGALWVSCSSGLPGQGLPYTLHHVDTQVVKTPEQCINLNVAAVLWHGHVLVSDRLQLSRCWLPSPFDSTRSCSSSARPKDPTCLYLALFPDSMELQCQYFDCAHCLTPHV